MIGIGLDVRYIREPYHIYASVNPDSEHHLPYVHSFIRAPIEYETN